MYTTIPYNRGFWIFSVSCRVIIAVHKNLERIETCTYKVINQPKCLDLENSQAVKKV